MRINELVLKANNFQSFNEMQEDCLDKLENNLVVSAPTASGKTIIAELFMLDQTINKKKKVIYTCPLRALASEHYKDFKRKYPQLKFSLSTGDLDSNSSYLKKFDVIFTTYEKLASLLRHRTDWLEQVGCLIVDEIHELDSDRGPVLEIAITQMRNHNQKLNVLGLSATIPNSKELASWLNAKLVESDFRPVKLEEGVAFEKEIEFKEKNKNEEKSIEEKLQENLVNSKQALIFLNSRKRAEGQAKKVMDETKLILNEKEKIDLGKISERVLNVLEQPTQQCVSLAETIQRGAAFHHAGLLPKQRELVEENFRNKKIKVICATPTLAAGVNTPADLVIIPSLYRYGPQGMNLIPVREYTQQAGRAGRPKFSDKGVSIVQANTKAQKELYLEKYVGGELEPIESKLSIVPILRTHVLGLVASQELFNDKSIWSFFEKTLYAKQLGEVSEIFEKVSGIIENLEEMGFVEKKGDFFYATKLGKRVSELFLDPESAFTLVNALKNEKPFDEMSYLFSWANCSEFTPRITVPKKLNAIILEEFNSVMKKLPFPEEKLFFETDSIGVFFSAMLLKEWINETREQELFEKFGLLPGTLFAKTRILEWLAYSTTELSKVLNENRHILPSKKLSLRIKYGVREELLTLIELKGIGRVRARKLFRAGVTRPSEIVKNLHKVESLLGKKVSEQLISQLKIIQK
jgi:helicase